MSIIENGECRIEQLNSNGIGVAKTKTGITEIPYVLEGEVVAFEKHEYRKQINSINLGIVTPSENRIKPPCQYYTICGGCMLQHMNQDSYIAFKYSLIFDAFAKFGITTDIRTIISLPSDGRRRTNMQAIKKNDQIFLGFQRFRSNQIINIDQCLTLMPALSNLIGPMRLLLLSILQDKEKVQIQLNIVHNGIDILIDYQNNKELTKLERNHISQFAIENNIVRVQAYCNGITESIYIKEIPYIKFGNIDIKTSTKSFLQANYYADKILQDLVLESLDISKKASVVDLFSGLGTFTIPLSKYFDVDAYESDIDSVQKLQEASLTHSISIEVFQHDLYSKPLNTSDLNKYKYAIINPPRLGAKKQIIELAQSNIETIVYVSCNPITFARDASILCSNDAGYKLSYITPVDQFAWNIHLEIVAVFIKNC